MEDQLSQLYEKISRRTGTPVEKLVTMALWEFVRSFDWEFEDLKEGVIYQPARGVGVAVSVVVH